MSQPSDPAQLRFGPFQLDERSGELRHSDRDTVRLSPQPARLLAHLARRAPEIVTRDEIAQLLWPDVEVDVEQSVHTCVRQVRRGLGDSAGEPRFLETIPRRGYRLVVSLEGSAADRPDRPRSMAPWVACGLVLAMALLGIVVVRSQQGGDMPETAPAAQGKNVPRIAVMPFEPLLADSPLNPGNPIAEDILRRIGNAPSDLEVVGPTTTAAYDGSPQRLQPMCSELRIDYVVNGREVRNEGKTRVLIEIIRARDGAHVWVRYLDEIHESAEAAEAISLAMLQQIESVP